MNSAIPVVPFAEELKPFKRSALNGSCLKFRLFPILGVRLVPHPSLFASSPMVLFPNPFRILFLDLGCTVDLAT